MEQIGGVDDIETAKALITYTDPANRCRSTAGGISAMARLQHQRPFQTVRSMLGNLRIPGVGGYGSQGQALLFIRLVEDSG
jgi:hypothetical protein